MKYRITLDRSFQMAAAAAANKLTQEAIAKAKGALRETAIETYAKAKDLAHRRLNTTAQSYSDALSFEEVSDDLWVISLDESAAHLEEGAPGFDMKPGLLRKNFKVSKKGFKYKTIPMELKGKGKPGTTRGDMMSDLKTLRKALGDTKNIPGFTGKAYSVTQDPISGLWNLTPGPGSPYQPAHARFAGKEIHKNLMGLTKIQYEQKTRRGVRTMSQFLTFRTVSENPLSSTGAKWKHPGWVGLFLFRDLENFALSVLSRKLGEIFKS